MPRSLTGEDTNDVRRIVPIETLGDVTVQPHYMYVHSDSVSGGGSGGGSGNVSRGGGGGGSGGRSRSGTVEGMRGSVSVTGGRKGEGVVKGEGEGEEKGVRMKGMNGREEKDEEDENCLSKLPERRGSRESKGIGEGREREEESKGEGADGCEGDVVRDRGGSRESVCDEEVGKRREGGKEESVRGGEELERRGGTSYSTPTVENKSKKNSIDENNSKDGEKYDNKSIGNMYGRRNTNSPLPLLTTSFTPSNSFSTTYEKNELALKKINLSKNNGNLYYHSTNAVLTKISWLQSPVRALRYILNNLIWRKYIIKYCENYGSIIIFSQLDFLIRALDIITEINEKRKLKCLQNFYLNKKKNRFFYCTLHVKNNQLTSKNTVNDKNYENKLNVEKTDWNEVLKEMIIKKNLIENLIASDFFHKFLNHFSSVELIHLVHTGKYVRAHSVYVR